MGTRSQPPSRSSGREQSQSVVSRVSDTLPSVSSVQTRALFFAVLMLMSIVAPFSAGLVDTVEAATGDEDWRVESSQSQYAVAHHDASGRTVSVGGETVTVVGDDGAEEWSRSYSDVKSFRDVAVGDDGTIYAVWDDRASTSDPEGTVAINPDTGDVKWAVNGTSGLSVAVDSQRGTVFVGAIGGFRALSTSDGSEKWNVTSTNDVTALGVGESAGQVYAGDASGDVTAFDSETGASQWSHGTGGNVKSIEVDAETGKLFAGVVGTTSGDVIKRIASHGNMEKSISPTYFTGEVAVDESNAVVFAHGGPNSSTNVVGYDTNLDLVGEFASGDYGEDLAAADGGDGVVTIDNGVNPNAIVQVQGAVVTRGYTEVVGVAAGSEGIMEGMYADGSVAWTLDLTASTVKNASSPSSFNTVASNGSVAFAGDGDGNIVATDIQTGAIVWEQSTGMGDIQESTLSDGILVVSGGSEVRALNASTGSEAWNASVAVGNDAYVSAVDGNLYSNHDSTGEVGEYDIQTGEKLGVKASYGGGMYDLAVSSDRIAVADNYDNLRVLDRSSGEELWTDTGAWTDVGASDGKVFASESDGTLSVFTSDGSLLYSKSESNTHRHEYGTFAGGRVIVGGEYVKVFDGDGKTLTSRKTMAIGQYFGVAMADGTSLPGSTDPGVGVSGRVVDQDGNAVPGASVEVWSVNKTTFEDPSKYDDRISELKDAAENPLPSEWKNQGGTDFDVKGSYGSSSGVYPLIHHESAWDRATSTPITGVRGGELSTPVVRATPGEPYRLSLWDATKESEGDAIGFTDPYDKQLTGASDSGEFKVEKLGPTGDVVDSYTASTAETHESKRALGGVQKTHETASVAFDAGIYRITAVESGNQYFVVSGDPDTISAQLSTELRTEAGELSKQAQDLQDRINASQFDRTVVTADENGEFSVPMDPAHETVHLQAYTSTGDILTPQELSDMTLDGVLNTYEQTDYNGSVYLPDGITAADPPESGVVVETREINSPTTDLENTSKELQELLDLFGAENYAELKSILMNPSESVNSTELQNRYNAIVVGLIEGTPLEPVFAELAEQAGVTPTIDKEHDRETMEEQLALAQQVIATAGTQSETTGEEIEIDAGNNESVTVTIPTDSDLEASDLTVIVGDDNGTSSIVPDGNVTEDTNVVGPDTIEVDLGFNASDLQKTVEVVTVDNETGDVTRDSARIQNPAFNGDIPQVESLNVDTLRPGVGDQVVVDATGGEGFRAVTGATVYSPTGEELTADVSGGEVAFDTTSAGVHTVQVALQSTSNDTVTETIRVKAVEERKNMPPTVSQGSGPTGQYAVASDGVDSARIDVSDAGQSVGVTARFADGDVPDNEVHVQALGAQFAAQDYTVRVTDETGSTINDAVTVAVHTSSVSDGAHIRVNGNAVPVGESNGYGSVERAGGGLVVHTVAEGGSVDVSVDNNPGILDRVAWFIETSIPSVPGMSMSVSPGVFAGFGVLVVGAVSRRESVVTRSDSEEGN